MSKNLPNLELLVYALVPLSRINVGIKAELIDHCQDILRSHLGHSPETNLTQLTDLVKRRLLQLSPNGSSASKFTNLASRLLDQPVLSRKQEAILFLFTLSTFDTHQQPAIQMPAVVQPRQPANSRIQPIPVAAAVSNKETAHSNADILKIYRAKKGIFYLDESLLIRDTLYLMQGISGKYVRLEGSKEGDRKTVEFPNDNNVIPLPTQALIRSLAELGHLYSRVESYVRERESASRVGMIEQSLCHYLQAQLTEYYRLIAILETQMSANDKDETLSGDEPLGGRETGLSLRRLDVWVNEWRLRMRMMSICVEGARDTHGGALVNLIHSYTDNGDPFVRGFTDELLEEVSRPFFTTLHKWLFSGELYDPFKEFFVSADSSLGHVNYVHPSSLPGGIGSIPNDAVFGSFNDAEERLGLRNGQKLWEAKYQFRREMLPAFVGESFGKKIFSTGKSLNFIRYSCLDSEWVVTREKMSNTGGTLQYNDIGGLERSIDSAYQVASSRLFEVFIDKFKLLDHLSALKNFLLLGHGDFADQLMETLGPSLSKAANSLFRHNLTASLETAIRSSNIQQDPTEILRRLDARMLEYSHGEIGWDVFTLEYKVDPPIDTVLDQEATEKYLKLFKHLWHMKRIEKALDKGWMKVTGARIIIRLPEMEFEFHKIRMALSEMIHFTRQLEAFCRIEVIEVAWKELTDFLHKKEGDLDALIGAHQHYLDRMSDMIFLKSSKPGKEEVHLRQLSDILTLILQFREATDNFYNHCLSESARRDQELDAERGVYTGPPQDDDAKHRDALVGIQERLNEYGSGVSERVQNLVAQLQVHTNFDCRFLATRLSFSDYYRLKKETQTKA
ncbi:gamma-tubulin complex, DGRIP91/SPC98 component [Crepidotus variabilis]|uniref:Gamma-tubulin complex, DGRIP91/SPC98 component n=1 Tax=Crepidotus variabilis TaxID=179855 RepID=A0A9P6ESX9_9AGAR|nr:gamma-tubulin complex, DGRIP91/SPC98 component [Crepidotus variabilis]